MYTVHYEKADVPNVPIMMTVQIYYNSSINYYVTTMATITLHTPVCICSTNSHKLVHTKEQVYEKGGGGGERERERDRQTQGYSQREDKEGGETERDTDRQKREKFQSMLIVYLLNILSHNHLTIPQSAHPHRSARQH